jgi:energy-coupling factor transporter ATP-binding protein EcfA2
MLQIDNLVFNGWGRRFFDSASVTLPAGAKVGLVGRNGVGKSTLFKLILGELIPDGGEIGLPKAARIASVDQEHPATPVTLIDTILAADVERDALNAALETAATARPRARRKSSAGSASPPPISRGRWRNSPAAGACGWRWRPRCSRSPTCCCWMSRPTTSTSKARSGSKPG